MADVARHKDIGQKIHLNALESVALARFTAPSLNVEAEPPWFVAAFARFGEPRIEIANRRKQSCVGGRVRAWRAANRRLIDANDFVDVLETCNPVVRSRFLT